MNAVEEFKRLLTLVPTKRCLKCGHRYVDNDPARVLDEECGWCHAKSTQAWSAIPYQVGDRISMGGQLCVVTHVFGDSITLERQ